MNTCGTNSNPGVLSPGDVIGAQAAYGRKATGSIVTPGGTCADVYGGFSDPGTPIITYACLSQFNDTWFQMRDNGADVLQANFPGSVARCLNVSGGVFTPGTPVISWTCDGGQNEVFGFSNNEWHGMGNMCATAAGTSAGSAIVMQPCNSNNIVGQRWAFRQTGTPGKTRIISLPFSNQLCVSAATAAGSLGEQLSLQPCNTSDSRQSFTLPGQGILGFGSFCANVLGGAPVSGSPIGLWNGCANTPRPYNAQFSIFGHVDVAGACIDSSNPNQVTVQSCELTTTSTSPQSWEYYL